jgi:PKD repeat protein
MHPARWTELDALLDGLRRRHLRTAWLGMFIEGLFIGFFALAAILLIDRTMGLVRGEPPWLSDRTTVGWLALAASALSAGAAAMLAWRRSPSRPQFAQAVDRRLDAEERVATAAEVAGTPSGGALGPALITDALGALRDVPAERLFPRPPIGYRALILLPMGVVVWLLTVPPAPPARGKAGPAATAPRPIAGGPPLADFQAEPRKGSAPCTVRFRALSAGRVDRYAWDFGDGTAPGSGAESVHTYREPGRYDVRLEVAGPEGRDVEVKPAHIEVRPPGSVVADFSAAPREGPAPLDVRFVSRLEGNVTGIQWVFGDGQSDDRDRNPAHGYAEPGCYTVRLDAWGPEGRDGAVKERYIAVGPHVPPEARFTADPRAGAAPLRVRFHDRSLGTVRSWRWDFGDGTPANTERNPQHVYERPGVYTVTLTVGGPAGTDTKRKKDYIHVSDDLARGGAGDGGGGKSGGASASNSAPRPPPSDDPDGAGQDPRGPMARGSAPGTEPSTKPTLGEPERTPVRKVPREVTPLMQDGGMTKSKVVEIWEGGGGSGGGAKTEAFDVLYQKYRRQAEETVHGESVPGSVRDLVRQYFEAIRPADR